MWLLPNPDENSESTDPECVCLLLKTRRIGCFVPSIAGYLTTTSFDHNSVGSFKRGWCWHDVVVLCFLIHTHTPRHCHVQTVYVCLQSIYRFQTRRFARRGGGVWVRVAMTRWPTDTVPTTSQICSFFDQFVSMGASDGCCLGCCILYPVCLAA